MLDTFDMPTFHRLRLPIEELNNMMSNPFKIDFVMIGRHTIELRHFDVPFTTIKPRDFDYPFKRSDVLEFLRDELETYLDDIKDTRVGDKIEVCLEKIEDIL